MEHRSRPGPKPATPVMELTDDTVRDLASMYYTADQIADRFNISKVHFLNRWGDAFREGKDHASQTPRRLLAKVFRDFEEANISFARKDANTSVLLDAITLYYRKYEGMGTKTVVEHIGQVPAYDKVETQPNIIQRDEESPE